MRRYEIHQAQAQFARLIEQAEAGEEVTIQRSGRPVARIVSIDERVPVAAAFGSMRGQITLRSDFDELPDEFANHFG